MLVLLERFYLHNRSHQRISFTNSKVSTTFQDPIIQSSCCKKWYCINIDSDLFFIISKELFAGLEKKICGNLSPLDLLLLPMWRHKASRLRWLFNKKTTIFHSLYRPMKELQHVQNSSGTISKKRERMVSLKDLTFWRHFYAR